MTTVRAGTENATPPDLTPVVVELSSEQQAQISPLMDAIAVMGTAGKPGMLVAQVFIGHMRVGVITNERAIEIAKNATPIREAPEVLKERAMETARLMTVIKPDDAK